MFGSWRPGRVPGRRFGLVAALAVASSTVGVGVAQAAETISPLPEAYQFNLPAYHGDQGDSFVFENPADSVAPHNVQSLNKGPDGRPLFRAAVADPGGSSAVSGTQFLSAGTYDFVCTIHPGMSSSIVVDPAGSPVARPKVKLAIPAQKLNRVRHSGKLNVSLGAVIAATGVKLSISYKSRKIGSAGRLNPLVGPARTVKIALTTSGLKSLPEKGKTKLVVTADVPWGSPVTRGTRLK